MRTLVRLSFCATLALLALACTSESGPAAPLNDHIALERLAQAFRVLSDQHVESPAVLPADERKRFVERVFKNAGYDYQRTLHAMALAPVNPLDRAQRDLVELLTFAHHGDSSPEALAHLYTREELADIQRIENQWNAPGL